MWSGTFALFLSCAGYSTYGYCPHSASTGSNLAGNGVTLTVRESPGWGPAFTSTSGLWNATGWVRGVWPLSFTSSALPGICIEWSALDGQAVAGTVDVSASKNQTTWTQCAAPGFTGSINTAAARSGPQGVQLVISATDATGVSSIPSKTVYVDNVPVGVTLSAANDPNPQAWANHAVAARVAREGR
jgi:hypothetical protein